MSDIFEERQAFNFYKSYYKTSLLLDTENRAEFLDCILHYQFTGELKEPILPMASLAFNGQIHSLKKQVNGFIKGKSTYPTGNPTKGQHKANDKSKGKQVQDKEEVQEEEKVKEVYKDFLFSEIKNFKEFYSSFKFNKQYFHIAFKFWEMWKEENPKSKTINSAKLVSWYETIRLIIESDKQKIERLIAVYKFFQKCQQKESGYRDFWFKTVKSVGGLRDTNKNGEYRLDKIADEVNDKIDKDESFGRLVQSSIQTFKNYQNECN